MDSIEKQNLYSIIKMGKDLGIAHQTLDKNQLRGKYISIKGHKVLNFSNCSYLGLELSPELIEGAINASEKYGIICSNSRSFFSSPLYEELEDLLQKMLKGFTNISTTTTLGHCSNLPLLIDKNDLIVLDIHSHNSIKMAAKICRAEGTDIKICT